MIFLGGLVIIAPIIVGSYDAVTLAIISALYILTLVLILEIKGKNVEPLIVVFVVYSLSSIGLRLCFLNYNVGSIRFGELVHIKPADLVFTVLMIWLSTLFIIAGLKIGGLLKINKDIIPKFTLLTPFNSTYSESFLFKYVLVLLPVALLSAIWVNKHYYDYWVNIFVMLSGYMAVFFLFIGHCELYWQQFSSKKRFFVLIICLLFIVMRAMVGSKGAIYQIVMTSILIMIVIRPNFYI